jgi:hypothetical protein
MLRHGRQRLEGGVYLPVGLLHRHLGSGFQQCSFPDTQFDSLINTSVQLISRRMRMRPNCFRSAFLRLTFLSIFVLLTIKSYSLFLADLLGCRDSGYGDFFEYSCPTADSQNAVLQSISSPVATSAIVSKMIYASNCSSAAETNTVSIAYHSSCVALTQPDSEGYSYGNPFCNATAQYYYGCDDSFCTNCTSTPTILQGTNLKY